MRKLISKLGLQATKKLAVLLAVFTVLLAVLIGSLLLIPHQNAASKKLEAERLLKQRELDELLLAEEEQRELSSMTNSREYLIRSLRQHQGYLFENDIRLDLADPAAVVPTPAPRSPSTEPPMAEPSASPSPAVQATPAE